MRQVEGTFELCQHPIMISNEFFLAVTSSFMKKMLESRPEDALVKLVLTCIDLY